MKNMNIMAPTSGDVFKLSDLKDKVFSNNMMGVGFAIESSDNVLRSPMSGKVSFIADTKHAVIISKDDVDVMVHVGIDTCYLGDNVFDIYCKESTVVKSGDPLMKVDFDAIKKSGLDTRVIVIVIECYDQKIVDDLPNRCLVNDVILTI